MDTNPHVSPPRSPQQGLIAAVVFASLVISGSIVFFALKYQSSDVTALLQRDPRFASILAKIDEEEGVVRASYSSLVDDDPVLGEKDAPVTIVEFSDYQCPFCRRHFNQTFPGIKQNYIDTGKAKLIFRDFPLSFHADAISAGIAANCARDEGGDKKYYEMHYKIFEGQQKLGSGTVSIPNEDLKRYARELGLQKDKFNACLEAQKSRSEIEADIKAGSSFGISGTPGFIITNGDRSKRIEGAQPYSVFESEIESFLR